MLGAVGFVGEPKEKAEHAAKAFKHHAVVDERHVHEDHAAQISDKEGSAGTSAPIVQDGEQETEGEDDDDVVYPGQLQLSLLTLGLCLATFTVALGTLIICSLCCTLLMGLSCDRPRSLDVGDFWYHVACSSFRHG